MRDDYPKNVLILAPHTDDGEFGCGGSISKLISNGSRVIYIAFSAAEESLKNHLDKNILRKEVKIATAELGIKDEDCIVLNHKVRKFNESRQEILDQMIEINKKYSPDLIFLPSTNDTHQDHQVISTEGFRAYKKSSILGYELPWNNINFSTDCFFCLSDQELNKKIESIQKYESQKDRIYSSPERIKALAITRGTQIGSDYAESFQVIRWIYR